MADRSKFEDAHGLSRWLWKKAELSDWYERRPRWFWRWLLRTMDRKHGYHFDYD